MSPEAVRTMIRRGALPAEKDQRVQFSGTKAPFAATAHVGQAACVGGSPQQARRDAGGHHGVVGAQCVRRRDLLGDDGGVDRRTAGAGTAPREPKRLRPA